MIARSDGPVAQIRREWAANPRLRLGAIAIGVILAVYLLLVLQDLRASLQDHYAERTGYLAKLQALSGQEVWLERASEVARVRAALEAEIPPVATVGIAQATVQGWLREAAVAFSEDANIQAETPSRIAEDSDIWRVPVVVSGKLDPARYVQLIGMIEKRPNLAVIGEAMILNRENRTFSLTVVSYYRVEGEVVDAGD